MGVFECIFLIYFSRITRQKIEIFYDYFFKDYQSKNTDNL